MDSIDTYYKIIQTLFYEDYYYLGISKSEISLADDATFMLIRSVSLVNLHFTLCVAFVDLELNNCTFTLHYYATKEDV